jgi:hydroxymethylglutaryl-CoA lyase
MPEMTGLPERVRIVEVGPRDGLQNESVPIPTETKLAFIRALVKAGLTEIEATSFVHPRAVPQLADAREVVAGLPAGTGVRFSALVPNEKGLDNAIESGIERVAVFTAASDAFTKHNIRMTIAESIVLYERMIPRALEAGLTVRGYISTSFVCPFEGDIDPQRVLEITKQLLEMGADAVAISDTIGAAAPNDIERVVGLLLEHVAGERLALHLHDTYGTALANVYAGLQLGITTFDASAGGLGGCPYAPGAAGNLATEDLVYLLDRLGIETGVDLGAIFRASRIIAGELGRDLPGKQYSRLKARGGERA